MAAINTPTLIMDSSSQLFMSPPDLCDSSVSSEGEESGEMLSVCTSMPCTSSTAHFAPKALSIKSAILLHLKPKMSDKSFGYQNTSPHSCSNADWKVNFNGENSVPTLNQICSKIKVHSEEEKEDVPEESTYTPASINTSCSPARKSVRFAQCEETGRIQPAVRRFATTDKADTDDVWWSADQLRKIRRVCSYVVSEYSSHGDDLILAYLRLQKKTLTSEEFRRSRQRLAESFETRGLEHIVAKAATDLQHRRYMETVMNAQRLLHARGAGNEADLVAQLAKVAQKESLASRQMAQRMALCDYHAAMHVHLEPTNFESS